MCSPSLKNAAWLERAQLILLIFHSFACKSGSVEGAAREKNYRQMYEKLEKLTERLLSNLHSLKLGEYNLLLSILTLRFINCVKCSRKLFAIGFPYKHCNFSPLCLPVKMAPKTAIRPTGFTTWRFRRSYSIL